MRTPGGNPGEIAGVGGGRAGSEAAWQLTGVEGYTESTATGLMAAVNLDRLLKRERLSARALADLRAWRDEGLAAALAGAA